ncbi:hypothetical protein [Dokdonella sp.]|uniref:hypothetical protein n=1 Tax=Dokdonella sp. TaxID=2291710 RepID=UPI001B07A14A|nr:hypothetical protein [Dokdonella sp.]MBO9663664.1 hypothetical protein [Dokdonella sp.]
MTIMLRQSCGAKGGVIRLIAAEVADQVGGSRVEIGRAFELITTLSPAFRKTGLVTLHERAPNQPSALSHPAWLVWLDASAWPVACASEMPTSETLCAPDGSGFRPATEPGWGTSIWIGALAPRISSCATIEIEARIGRHVDAGEGSRWRGQCEHGAGERSHRGPLWRDRVKPS